MSDIVSMADKSFSADVLLELISRITKDIEGLEKERKSIYLKLGEIENDIKTAERKVKLYQGGVSTLMAGVPKG